MNFDDFDIDSFGDFAEYPYHGYFVRFETDESLDLDKQEETEILVYETDCDIQERTNTAFTNLLGAFYRVYFPLELNPDATGSIDKYKDCGVRRGHIFRGTYYGTTIEGQVVLTRPSQLGAMSVVIKVITEDNGND